MHGGIVPALIAHGPGAASEGHRDQVHHGRACNEHRLLINVDLSLGGCQLMGEVQDGYPQCGSC
jgi:hypothetical protein